MFTFKCPKCKKAVIEWNNGKPQVCPNPVCRAPFKTIRREWKRLRNESLKVKHKESKQEQNSRYNDEAPNVRIPSPQMDRLNDHIKKQKAKGLKIKKKDVVAEALQEYLDKFKFK